VVQIYEPRMDTNKHEYFTSTPVILKQVRNDNVETIKKGTIWCLNFRNMFTKKISSFYVEAFSFLQKERAYRACLFFHQSPTGHTSSFSFFQSSFLDFYACNSDILFLRNYAFSKQIRYYFLSRPGVLMPDVPLFDVR